jgi:hypothetical protein
MIRTRRQSPDAEEDEYECSNVIMDGFIRRVPAGRPLKSGASLRPAYDEYLLGRRPENQRLRATGRAEGDDTKLPSGPMVDGEGQFVIAEPDKKSWEQFEGKKRSLADLQKMAALALPPGFSATGTSLRGKSIKRNPRITKADRQRMEQQRRDREALEQLASKLSDQQLFSDEESSDANIAHNHSPKTQAFLGGLSRGPVNFGQMSRAFKPVGYQPWKPSKTQTSIHYTISRDNTCGESARQAKLFSGFGRKGGVCALSISRAFVGDGDAAEENYDHEHNQSKLDEITRAQSPPPRYPASEPSASTPPSPRPPPFSSLYTSTAEAVEAYKTAVTEAGASAVPAYAPVALESHGASTSRDVVAETKAALPQDTKGESSKKDDDNEPPPAYSEGSSPLEGFTYLMAAAGGAASIITQVQQGGAPPINTLGGMISRF